MKRNLVPLALVGLLTLLAAGGALLGAAEADGYLGYEKLVMVTIR
jgi:hypothetical protein